jgi:hypothetical protein
VNPSGSFQRIIGDVSPGLSISYQILDGLELSVFGLYTSIASAVRLDHDFSSTIRRQNVQDISFCMLEAGVGVGISILRVSDFEFVTSFHVSRALATLGYDYRYRPTSITSYTFEGSLEDKAIGWRGGVKGKYRVWGPFALSVGAEYRYLKLNNLEGDIKEIYRSSSPEHEEGHTFRGRLAQRDGYFFGLIETGGTISRAVHLTRTLWERTKLYPSWWNTLQEATLDLSSFAIRIELMYEF